MNLVTALADKYQVFAEKKYEIMKLPITLDAHLALIKLDEKYIATDNYMGIAFFWDDAYKHTLRSASPVQCKKVHDAWLKANLDLAEESPQHQAILDKIIK